MPKSDRYQVELWWQCVASGDAGASPPMLVREKDLAGRQCNSYDRRPAKSTGDARGCFDNANGRPRWLCPKIGRFGQLKGKTHFA
jgi:hypothetical protein